MNGFHRDRGPPGKRTIVTTTTERRTPDGRLLSTSRSRNVFFGDGPPHQNGHVHGTGDMAVTSPLHGDRYGGRHVIQVDGDDYPSRPLTPGMRREQFHRLEERRQRSPHRDRAMRAEEHHMVEYREPEPTPYRVVEYIPRPRERRIVFHEPIYENRLEEERMERIEMERRERRVASSPRPASRTRWIAAVREREEPRRSYTPPPPAHEHVDYEKLERFEQKRAPGGGATRPVEVVRRESRPESRVQRPVSRSSSAPRRLSRDPSREARVYSGDGLYRAVPVRIADADVDRDEYIDPANLCGNSTIYGDDWSQKGSVAMDSYLVMQPDALSRDLVLIFNRLNDLRVAKGHRPLVIEVELMREAEKWARAVCSSGDLGCDPTRRMTLWRGATIHAGVADLWTRGCDTLTRKELPSSSASASRFDPTEDASLSVVGIASGYADAERRFVVVAVFD